MTETTPTNPLAFDLTLFSSIFRLEGVPKKASWADLVAAFAEPLRAPNKTEVPGFGPYVLRDRACDRPRHPKTAHRCDVCVDAVSLAVFDVDAAVETISAEQISMIPGPPTR